MLYRLLGPLEASDEGRPIPLGGRKQRLVLATLLLRANQVVGTEQLIDETWGDDPPKAARITLQSYVSTLRRAIGGSLERESGGYVLHVAAEEVDANRFETAVTEARALVQADPSAAAAALEGALAMWRGPALADLSDHPSLRGHIARLEDLRIGALEQLIALEMSLGRDPTAIGRLEIATVQHPLRERLWGQLMVALYRSGRQGEAVSVYHRARTMLAEELGIDPSPELQQLHRQLLNQDPSIGPERRVSSLAAPAVEERSGTAGHRPLRPKRSRPTRRWQPRRRAAVGLLGAATATLLAVATLQVVGGQVPVPSFEPGVAIVDQRTGERIASIPTSVIRQPDRALYADGHFWFLDHDPVSFVEVDPKTGRVLAQVGSPFDEGTNYAVSGNTLWVTGPQLAKMDINLRREVDRFDLGDFTTDVVAAEGSLWVAVPDLTIDRIDTTTRRIQSVFSDLPAANNLGYGDGVVWAAGQDGMTRIDPETNTVANTNVRLPADCCPVAAGGGFGWTADPIKGVVYKVDRAGQIVATYQTGQGARVGSFDNGWMWVANSDEGTVAGIDAVTGERRTFTFDHPVQSVAAGGGLLAVALAPGRTYEDRIDALQGQVARLLTPLYALETPDSATLESRGGFWVESATCAKLLNYKDGPAPGGWRLRPEVAASMPKISGDGRTYTFRIRSGYRFSPPSNEPLTADTFRHSIERALSPRVDGPGPVFISDIEGESAFLAGEVDHISGLEANGGVLTITLERPSPDFLERLALPFFCPVPNASPLVNGGAGAYVAYPGRSLQPVPSAGPYFIADHLNAEYAILKPNPNYPGPRPQRLDAIALREGIDPSRAVSLVEGGSWDGIVAVEDPILTPQGPIANQHPMATEAAGKPILGYYAAPLPATGFVAFNSSRHPFSDPDVRRAAALALDREALAEVWGALPTDQFLAPVLPGFHDRKLYPLNTSVMDGARSLVPRRSGTVTMAIAEACDACRQEAEIVRADLARIGIKVRIKEFPDPVAVSWAPSAQIDLLSISTPVGYSDAASFLAQMLVRSTPRLWLPQGVAAKVKSLLGMEGRHRQIAASLLADQLATKDVPLAATRTPVEPVLLGPGLGCRVFPPFGYGVDLAALCLTPQS